ncbi:MULTISPECIES: OprO/OprP family phosphate-selective porin [Hydrogenophaga]|uniref:Outer membrane protein D1 n=1 Tax=Hydrogenophaga intermedia TaxID=65786 RepID=A0A1L1PD20_HYDIT|nr:MULTISPECIES: porin [Hydrogenophaga]CDN85639.1 Outer membrane protein D1 [Hydrogenophaga intermedia]
MKRCGIFTATAIVAAILAGGPAAAQDSASARLEALKAEISKLQNEVATLKGDVAEGREEARGAAEQVVAARTATPADAPSVRVSSSNRPTICSPDGRNCISLTSRLQLDFGGYNYRPNTIATTPQDLVGGAIARRAQFGVIGTFLDDWEYNLVFEGGGSGGATSAVFDKGYLTYSGFKPFKIWGGILSVPYMLDRATSNNNITFMERAAPVEVAAGIGGATRSAFGITANDRQWWAGAFLTGPASGRTSHDARQTAATGRVVFLPVLTDSASLLIGGDVQYLFDAPTGASELNLRDRIEMRIDGNRILGTGPLPIDSARVLSAELAGTLGSFHFQGEYFDFNVEPTPGNGPSLDFSGYYIQGGYILTGEKRSYSASSGSYGSVAPSRPFDWRMGDWGAWEIAARYSMIDLNDRDIFGGRQENLTLGLNWYVNSNIRFMLNYINGTVDKRTGGGGDIGARYQAVGARTQIAF